MKENTQILPRGLSSTTVTNPFSHTLQRASIAVASTGFIIGSNACQVIAITCVEPVEASAALVFCPL